MTATAVLVEPLPRLGDALTPRELQVVGLVAEGRSNPEIGKALRLSPLTVKRHMRRIGEKLGAGDRAGIVAQAYRTGQLRVARSGDVELEERLTAVLLGIARGLSNAQIAVDLFVAESTVKSRVLVLFRLLGVHDRAAAVRAGLECGAISLVPRARVGSVDRANPAGASQRLQIGQAPTARPPRPSRGATGPLRPSLAACTPDAQVPR